MSKQKTSWSAAVVLMALPFLQGCGDDVTGPVERPDANDPVRVDRLELSPGRLEIQLGTQYQLTVKLNDRDISPQAVNWSSSDTEIALVSDDGLVEGLAEGIVTITAEYQERIGTASVRVSTATVRAEDDNEWGRERER